MTGYELKSAFDNSINFFWNAPLSQIYRELGALEKKNYLESRVEAQQGKPDKKIYSITQPGKEEFLKQLNDFPSFYSAQLRDEFLLRLFFGPFISKEELEFQLRKAIKESEAAIEPLRKLEKDMGELEPQNGDSMFFQMLTLKQGLMYYEMKAKWAEYCLQELRNYHPADND
jgi:DNA-binding PadR family transcriptional regulator